MSKPHSQTQPHAVPQRYLGAWRRDYIRRANGTFDNTTQCWWLQAAHYHIDLRVPADRPSLADRQALEQLDGAAKQAYMRQTAWTGRTEVNGERCQWWPDAAWPGLSDEPDIGVMRFESDDEVIETCPDGRYVERWVRIGSIIESCTGVRLAAADANVDATLTIIVAGKLGGAALDVAGNPLEVSIAQAAAPDTWRVLRATSPWLEGEPSNTSAAPHPCAQWLKHVASAQAGAVVPLQAGGIGRWHILG